jgi:hypothetical protein
MLEIIKYSEDKNKITFRCPKCHGIIHDSRVASDPKDSVYAIVRCDGCSGDGEDFIFYDKYDRAIKISEYDEYD